MLLFMSFEAKNHRFNMSDFKVYYTAASRIIHGENLYRPLEDGHYYYKYSPEAAIYFIPVSIFNYTAARIIYWTFLSVLMCFGFYLALKLVYPNFREDQPGHLNKLILLIGLILSTHLQRELHLGQVNHILLVMYIAMVYLYKQNRKALMSIIWALSIFIKPHGLIFLPYFIVKRKFKEIGWFMLSAAVIALTPLLFYDSWMTIDQHLHWFKELSIELSYKQALTDPRIHTIFSLLVRYTPLRLLDFAPIFTKAFQVSILLTIGGLFLYLIHAGRKLKDSHIAEMAILISLIPLLASTGSVAFAFSELMIFLIIFNWQSLTRWMKITAVTGFIFLGGNWHDLLTHKVSVFIEDISLLAIGAVMLIIVLSVMRIRKIV